LAALSKHRDPDAPDVVEARQQLKAINAEEYIQRLVASAPPLSAETRARLAGILAPTVSEFAHDRAQGDAA
jgi:hypothetical protein